MFKILFFLVDKKINVIIAFLLRKKKHVLHYVIFHFYYCSRFFTISYNIYNLVDCDIFIGMFTVQMYI